MDRHAKASQLRSEDMFRQVLGNDDGVRVAGVLFKIGKVGVDQTV